MKNREKIYANHNIHICIDGFKMMLLKLCQVRSLKIKIRFFNGTFGICITLD